MNKKIFDYSYTLKKQKQHRDLMIFIYIILAILFITITFKLFIFPVRQQSTTMTPNIKKQSFLMVTPLVKTPSRGDVIMLKPFNQKKIPFFKGMASSATSLVTGQQVSLLENKKIPGTTPELRRVIGIPGDTVYISDFIAHVKPANEKHFLSEYEMQEKNYSLDITVLPEDWDKSINISDSSEEIVLGENEYFVLCDNRNVYNDSRIWGVIQQDLIKGRVLFCYFPFSQFKAY